MATTETRSACCYCGVGCGVIIESDGNQVTGVRGDPDHPANFGKLCSKGSTLALTMQPGAMSGRARHPELRTQRDQPRQRATWDATLDHLSRIFAETIEKHGPDSVGFYISGQLLTEDYYVFNKLAKGLIGTNNVDTNSRLCMSSAVTGYQATLGVDAPPCSYEDIDHVGCLFIAGSNTAYAHPILFRRIEAAREKNPELKMIVVDPRRTETARAADLHLPILPGTDVALFHAMLHVMLWEEWIDRDYISAHTEGFDALRTLVREYSPQAAAEICGVKADDIITAARWFATSGPALSLYCQGLNQSTSGTAKNASLINLHLATGQIGKPGAGPFSLTGQPNAMGGREVGGLATTLAAHRDIANPEHRAEVTRLWGVDRLSAERGKTAVEMFDAVKSGEIKLLWIACTNPAQSMPDLANIRKAMEAAECVVLQETYANTETAAFADVLLPASSWGEKSGTVTNSERRISRVRAVLPAPGEAKHDWQIVCEFARRLERRLRPGRESLFPFATVEEVWNEHRALTAGRDLDITGLSYALLETKGPQQWPFTANTKEGAARLYADGRFPTPTGKARFHAAPYKPVAEKVDARHPLRLTTGRLRDHWHGLSRTGTAVQLFGHVPEPALALNPGDVARRGLADGDLVRVESKRGALHVRVEADESVRSGQAYLPMHWGKRWLGGRDSAGVNGLTTPAFDPISRQPELKHAAVKVTVADLSWRMVAFAALPEGEVMALHDALQPLQTNIDWFSAVPIGRGDSAGLLVRAAHAGAPEPAWLERLDCLFELTGADVSRYDDARRGSARRMRIVGEHLVAARLSGGIEAVASAEWLREWMLAGRSVAAIRRQLLMATAAPPADYKPAGRVLCNCFGVTADAACAALAAAEGSAAERLAAVQAGLRCGTNCGSCLPELRGLAKDAAASQPVLVEAA
ncbi:MAG: molybdopterin-dependent oxidoreductase [Burkholderiales bacterium]|nr:molybdopterin-dependent oxidoreductase [Burkholderiales bacterium]